MALITKIQESFTNVYHLALKNTTYNKIQNESSNSRQFEQITSITFPQLWHWRAYDISRIQSISRKISIDMKPSPFKAVDVNQQTTENDRSESDQLVSSSTLINVQCLHFMLFQIVYFIQCVMQLLQKSYHKRENRF